MGWRSSQLQHFDSSRDQFWFQVLYTTSFQTWIAELVIIMVIIRELFQFLRALPRPSILCCARCHPTNHKNCATTIYGWSWNWKCSSTLLSSSHFNLAHNVDLGLGNSRIKIQQNYGVHKIRWKQAKKRILCSSFSCIYIPLDWQCLLVLEAYFYYPEMSTQTLSLGIFMGLIRRLRQRIYKSLSPWVVN